MPSWNPLVPNGSSGTVFSVTKFGRENLVYSFNGNDGSQPYGGVIDVKGVLYGTSYMGGVKNVGSLFSVTKTGEEKVLHSFSAGSGKNPISGLLDVGGTCTARRMVPSTNNAKRLFVHTVKANDRLARVS